MPNRKEKDAFKYYLKVPLSVVIVASSQLCCFRALTYNLHKVNKIFNNYYKEEQLYDSLSVYLYDKVLSK